MRERARGTMAPLLAMKPPPTSKPGTSKGKKGEAPAKPPKKSTADRHLRVVARGVADEVDEHLDLAVLE